MNVSQKECPSAARRAGLIGSLFGLVAAIGYGLVPLFTLPIGPDSPSPDRLSDPSILFYRFLLAAIVIGIIMLVRRKSFRVTRPEMVTLIYLSFLSDGSALFTNEGYHYMTSGAATTLRFMYPVMTAIIMMAFYHEARRLSTISAVVMSVVGVAILSWQPDGGAVSLRGIAVMLVSALCYALYIIRVNRSRVRDMDVLKLTFYVLAIGAAIFAAEAVRHADFQLVSTASQAGNLLLLGLVCTVVTNLCLVGAVKRIGSTMTAVLGALEPLTAVAVGCIVFGEALTWTVLLGVGLIISAVVIIIFTRRR